MSQYDSTLEVDRLRQVEADLEMRAQAAETQRDAYADNLAALREVAQTFLARSPGRWIDRGFGQFACSSCGAQLSVDYGDHKQPSTETREPCSRTCPWQKLHAAAYDD